MKTRTARELRKGIQFGTTWANAMLNSVGNPYCQALLMQEVTKWTWQNTVAARRAATRTMRTKRLRFEAARA